MTARSGHRLRQGLGVAGAAFGLLCETVAFQAGQPASVVLLHLAINWTYLFGGLVIWGREPGNRTGKLMVAVGFAGFARLLALSDIPGLHEVVSALQDQADVLLIALVLAYPSGRIQTTIDRATIVILSVSLLVLDSEIVSLPGDTDLYLSFGLAILAAVVVLRRWVVATGPQRHELLPVLVAGMVLMVAVAANLLRRIFDLPEGINELLVALLDLAPAAVPVALLVGFYQKSEARNAALIDAIPDLLVRIDPAEDTLDLQTVKASDTPDMILGERLRDELSPELAAAMLTTARRSLDGRTLETIDLKLDAGAGRRHRELEARIVPNGETRSPLDRPRRHRATDGRGGASPIASPDRRGHRRRTPTSGARPARWRPAATGVACRWRFGSCVSAWRRRRRRTAILLRSMRLPPS